MSLVIDLTHFRPFQRKFWLLERDPTRQETFLRGIVAGYGSGKTYIGALRAIFLCSRYSALGMVIAPTFAMAELTVIPTLKEMLDSARIRYTFNETKHLFKIHDLKGNIKVASGDTPDSLKGPTLGWVWIDEPFLQKREVLMISLSRVRSPLVPENEREIFFTGTPEALGWGYGVCMNDHGAYHIKWVRGSTRENIAAVGEGYLKTLESAYSAEEVQAYLEGRYVNLLQGRVYKPFDRSKHLFKRPDLAALNLPIIAGIDFNVDYMTAVVAYKGPNWLHFFDEIRLSNSNTFELALALKEKYPRINVFPDPTGTARKSSASQSDHRILEAAGFRVYSKGRVAVKDRVNAVNKLLRHDDLSIEGCPHLIADLERNVWKSGDIDKRDLTLTHAADAPGYLVEYLYPVMGGRVKVVPRWGGPQPMTYKEVQGLIRRRIHAWILRILRREPGAALHPGDGC